MSNLPVAETILEQLGGRRFRVMTGARNFIGCATYLSFRLPGARGFTKQGINYVRIELMPSDTYTVTFSRIRSTNVAVISKHENIYCDALQELFTRETGLATHL